MIRLHRGDLNAATVYGNLDTDISPSRSIDRRRPMRRPPLASVAGTCCRSDEPDYFKQHRKDFIDRYIIEFFKVYPMKMLVADDQPAMQTWIRRRITPYPAKPWTDTLVLRTGGWEGLKRTCFRTTRQGFAPSGEKMWGTATQPGWRLVAVPTDRMGMTTVPSVVAPAFAGLVA